MWSCSSGLMFFSQSNSDLKRHIEYLASDELGGRFPGTKGDSLAATYIRDQFKQIGLNLLEEEGLQPFNVVTGLELGSDNFLSFRDFKRNLESDFIPLAFSSNMTLSADAVFCGYGFDIEMHGQKINDYEDVNVNGKWVLLLRGSPEGDNPHGTFGKISSDRDKVTTAKDNGAAGVILVSGSQFDPDDILLELKTDGTFKRTGIPVIQITRSLADEILQSRNVNLDELESLILSEKDEFSSFPLNIEITAAVDIREIEKPTFNVIGKIEGTDSILKHEVIVLGAHYDHLGMGGNHSGSRRPDQHAIHNGADDNASGVTGLIRLAKKFKLEKSSKRSLVFVAFGAEEMGLLGSKYFIESTFLDNEKIQLMVNMDMIGRFNSDKGLAIGGSGTALKLEARVDSILNLAQLEYSFKPEGYGPSDHSSFYVSDIPVLFFFTGAHDDYHTPQDDPEKINYIGIKTITDAIYSVTEYFSGMDQKLVFQEAGPKESQARSSFKVTLGIMPDYVYSGKGLRVDAVKKEGPARKAGLVKGDIIIEMDGKSVNDIYEYMHRLNELDTGDNIMVRVKRHEEDISLNVQF